MHGAQLWGRLRVDDAPVGELRIVLGSHFGSARHRGGDAIEYLKAEEVALSVTYDKGRVTRIAPGPALTSGDVAALEEKLERSVLADSGTRVRRQIAFSAVPVTGSWRYRDSLQILPAPPQAPRPQYLLGDHPFVLEVTYAHSEEFTIALERAFHELDEVNLVLAGALPWIDHRPRNSQQQWAIPVGGEAVPKRSMWTQTTYRFEGFEAIADALTSEPGPPLRLVEDSAYYARIGVSSDDTLELPASIETMLDRFYALEEKRRERFLRWCYWLNHSRRSRPLSMSASYMAVIQAIEALRPELPGGPRCAACGRTTGAGSTRQFVDFMDAYVPRQDGETEKERTTLYALRSSLTHGGNLLEQDRGMRLDSFHPRPLQEFHSADRASRLARLAGLNWLLGDGE